MNDPEPVRKLVHDILNALALVDVSVTSIRAGENGESPDALIEAVSKVSRLSAELVVAAHAFLLNTEATT